MATICPNKHYFHSLFENQPIVGKNNTQKRNSHLPFIKISNTTCSINWVYRGPHMNSPANQFLCSHEATILAATLLVRSAPLAWNQSILMRELRQNRHLQHKRMSHVNCSVQNLKWGEQKLSNCHTSALESSVQYIALFQLQNNVVAVLQSNREKEYHKRIPMKWSLIISFQFKKETA